MTRRYGILIALVLLGAVAVSLLARRPRERTTSAEPAALPVAELALRSDGARLVPESSMVPKGHRVQLVVTNDGGAPLSLRLAGYEDRFHADSLAPGATWRGEFVADRPGEDFVWLVNGEPRGRLAVTGSHLIEGHR